eukprot:s521_g4.t1
MAVSKVAVGQAVNPVSSAPTQQSAGSTSRPAAGGSSVWVTAPEGVSAEARLAVRLPESEFTRRQHAAGSLEHNLPSMGVAPPAGDVVPHDEEAAPAGTSEFEDCRSFAQAEPAASIQESLGASAAQNLDARSSVAEESKDTTRRERYVCISGYDFDWGSQDLVFQDEREAFAIQLKQEAKLKAGWRPQDGFGETGLDQFIRLPYTVYQNVMDLQGDSVMDMDAFYNLPRPYWECTMKELSGWTHYCETMPGTRDGFLALSDQDRALVLARIENGLLLHGSDQPIAMGNLPAYCCLGQKMDRGQILQGMVRLVKLHYGSSWPEHVGIFTSDILTKTDLIERQNFPRLMFTLLHMSTCDALLVLRRDEWVAALFDGSNGTNGDIWRAAESLLSDYELARIPVPQQTDEWSSGHRLLLHAKALLEGGLGLLLPGNGWVQAIKEIPIEADSICEVAMVQLCEDSKKQPTTVKVEKIEPFGACSSKSSSSAVSVPTLARGEVKRPKIEISQVTSAQHAGKAATRASSQVAEAPVKGQGVEDKMDQLMQELPGPVKQEALPEVPRVKPEPEEEALFGSPLYLDPGLAEAVQDIHGQRAEKVKARKAKEFAKKILVEGGFDFNVHFQKRHAERLKQGHWDNFLNAVSLTSRDQVSLSCEICRNLLEEFKLPECRARLLARDVPKRPRSVPSGSPPGASVTSSPPPSQPEPDLVPAAAASEDARDRPAADAGNAARGSQDASIAEPAAKRPRGRPRRGDAPEFDLMKFLAESRPETYVFLSQEEAGAP